MSIKFLMSALIIASILSSCSNMGSGMKKTINGHQYKITEDQPGETIKEGQYAYFTYKVKIKDSLLYDSESNAPVIKAKMPKIEKKDPKNSQPIEEVLTFMSKGDKAVATQELLPEFKKQLGLPETVQNLDFEIALVDIKSEADYNAEMEAENKIKSQKMEELKAQLPTIEALAKKTLSDYKSGALKSKIMSTPSGLKYYVHEEGTGAQLQAGKKAHVNYYGLLVKEGTKFDDSWSRGEVFSFPLGQGQVIPGWEEGVSLMKEGSKVSFFIPATLAYGEKENGPIPANSELMFYIEAYPAAN